MKKTLLPLLGLSAALFFLSGCATQKTSTGRDTTFLAGVATVNTGSFQPPAANTVPTRLDRIVGRGNPSGTEYQFLWGLLTFTDY